MKNKLILIALAFTTPTISAQSLSIEPGIFELYSTPHYTPDSSCDTGIKLTLDEGTITGPFAVLENFVAGFCEIYANPDQRIYILEKLADEPCGSKIYQGQRSTLEGTAKIEIVDHRGRRCRDSVPAKIIVKEEIDSNISLTFYSNGSLEPIRICTAVAGMLINPKNGECIVFTNGCQMAEMLEQGYVEPLDNQCQN
ncbi:MAG: hypothetical protein R3B45_05915 [Bdellovibrionota bacterium]